MAKLAPLQQRRVEELMEETGVARRGAEDIVRHSANGGLGDAQLIDEDGNRHPMLDSRDSFANRLDEVNTILNRDPENPEVR